MMKTQGKHRLRDRIKARVKRAMDVGVCLAGLPVLAGPMAATALLVRATSKGPVLYWSDRVGEDNRLFPMPKFRTMRTDTPEVATHLLDDPSRFLTPVGSFLRKTSLDELPQLYSVLVGDMSLVGPRPALHNQDDLVAQRTARGVHKVKPGLTGWAQINGRDEIPLDAKVALDAEYVERQSPAFDARVLLGTVAQVVKREDVSH